MESATKTKSIASFALPAPMPNGSVNSGRGNSSYPIHPATSIIFPILVRTSREFSMTGRKLSRTGLPLKMGQRTGFSFARVVEFFIKDEPNERASGKNASDPAKYERKRRRSSIADFI